MKKLMCLILALVTALSLVACGSSNGGNNTNTGDVKLKVLEGVVDWPETEPYRVLVQKGDPKGLLPGINKAIAELTADNNAKIHEIEEKVASTDTFTPDSVPSDAVAAPETSTSGKLVLVMGTSPDYPPYEFYSDSAMTQFAGIDVEVAKYIAESMGLPV